ncbi:MAG: glycosyltransferase family 4 protein [Verrucomicrobia bacterium]|nr:glycosyltransferase family 4 protein [Verrucomicrobiota bacterium]
MRILQLTPGTGAYHCGGCLRDLALVRALRARGHDVTMVPLYLPIVNDAPVETSGTPVFLSGISVFLERKFRVPRWLDRVFSAPALLRASAKLAHLTTAKDLGESAVAMLTGAPPELDRLLDWLRTQPRFDVVCLSNSLLTGMARRLKQELRAPLVATLQGEDTFLDGLVEPYRARSWQLLAERSADVDRFIAVSRFFADLMRPRLHIAADRVSVVHNGIALEEFTPAALPPAAPTVGFLSRMHHDKGLGLLADAFAELNIPNARLRVAGAMTNADKPLVATVRRKLGDRVEFLPNIERDAKIAFLQSLNVLSVPTLYAEAFGLYVLESLACAVPVVQPRHGAFPELIESTGGGLLCEPNDSHSLAAALRELLADPARARELGQAGRAAVQEKFSVEKMAQSIETILLSA